MHRLRRCCSVLLCVVFPQASGMQGPSLHARFYHALCFAPAVGITYCTRCGAWAARKPRKLQLTCPLAATTVAAQQALLRLKRGIHPSDPIHQARGPRTAAPGPPRARRARSGPSRPQPVPPVLGPSDGPRHPFHSSHGPDGLVAGASRYWDDPRAASILQRVRTRSSWQ